MKHFGKNSLVATFLMVSCGLVLTALSARAEGETPPHLALRTDEIMLQGRIEGVSFASRQVTISFDSITAANGFVTTLAPPRWKTVAWSNSTSFFAPPLVELPPPDVPPEPTEEGELPPDGEMAPTEGAPPVPVIDAPVTPPALTQQPLTVDSLWPRKAVAVVGKNLNGGRLFSARVIEIGGPRAGLYQPAPETIFADSRFYNGVKEWVAASGLRAAQKFSIPSIGGKALRGNPTSDHPRGLALDFMVGRNVKLGDLIATYFQQYAGQENVNYIIWKDHLAYVNPRTDWSKIPVDYTGNITLRHMDHVHVSFLPTPEMPGPWLTEALTQKSRPVARRSTRRSLGRRAR